MTDLPVATTLKTWQEEMLDGYIERENALIRMCLNAQRREAKWENLFLCLLVVVLGFLAGIALRKTRECPPPPTNPAPAHEKPHDPDPLPRDVRVTAGWGRRQGAW